MQLCDNSVSISLAIFTWLAESKAAKSSCLSCWEASSSWMSCGKWQQMHLLSCTILPCSRDILAPDMSIVPKHTAFVFWVLRVKQGRREARQVTLWKLKGKSHSYRKDLICHDKSLMLIFLKRNPEYIISISVFLYWYKN